MKTSLELLQEEYDWYLQSCSEHPLEFDMWVLENCYNVAELNHDFLFATCSNIPVITEILSEEIKAWQDHFWEELDYRNAIKAVENSIIRIEEENFLNEDQQTYTLAETYVNALLDGDLVLAHEISGAILERQKYVPDAEETFMATVNDLLKSSIKNI